MMMMKMMKMMTTTLTMSIIRATTGPAASSSREGDGRKSGRRQSRQSHFCSFRRLFVVQTLIRIKAYCDEL